TAKRFSPRRCIRRSANRIAAIAGRRRSRAPSNDDLQWYFAQRQKGVRPPGLIADARFQRAQDAFASPRFRVLYRTWLQVGDAALQATLSPVLAEALARRSGQLECHVLPHPYQHLASLVGT